ncbi:hypothetical protein KVR01_009611 [Diaporthe batatas]|uniref:uncharacterized protein n=1 Tax=Diaporthe batatas TaxID=748121 RepID=UPI001D054067|nr:uncharacterized protein KVR01_009611 [Diaporthe batatas]KAG8161347.1 hypothetical protein KVR01_009611 [Diaporthe batatas]
MDVATQKAAIARWRNDVEVSTDTTYDETLNTVVQTAEAEYNEEVITSGHETLLGSEAYQWLVSVLKRDSRLNGIEPHCMSRCREVMSQLLQKLTDRWCQRPEYRRLITSKRQPPLYRARFTLPWDPLSFLREEYEGESPGDVVSQVITLTGDGLSVQAQTCRGYLEQVWSTTGSDFMDLIVDLVTRPEHSCERVLPDRTELSATLHGKTCVIEALGTQSSLSDVAEQILWISTTLRVSSDTATGVTLCSAHLIPTEIQVMDDEVGSSDQGYNQRCLGKVKYQVEYTTDTLPNADRLPQGYCWMQLFPSCSVQVTNGYPIPSRKHQRPGLELPLDIMVFMIGADRVTQFSHDLIIKGYSDLFYATEQKDGCIMWHLICNEPDPVLGASQISFADVRVPQATDRTLSLLPIDDVPCMRHIIGWTSEVRSNAAPLVLNTAQLPHPNSAAHHRAGRSINFSSPQGRLRRYPAALCAAKDRNRSLLWMRTTFVGLGISGELDSFFMTWIPKCVKSGWSTASAFFCIWSGAIWSMQKTIKYLERL